MVRFRSHLLVPLLVIAAAHSIIDLDAHGAQQKAISKERCLRLELYVRSDSALCQEAKTFAEAFSKSRDGICLEVIDTIDNKAGLDRYWQLVRRFRVENPRVPLFYACNQLKIGFKDAKTSAASIEQFFAVHAYIRPTCPHCRDAMRFLTELAVRWKGVRTIFHNLETETGAVQQMNLLAQQHGIAAPAFPVISLCGRVISGYRTDATTGQQIEELLINASVEGAVDVPVKRQAKQLENRGVKLLRPAFSLTTYAGLGVWEDLDDEGPLPTASQDGAAGEPGSSSTEPQADLPPIDAKNGDAEPIYIAPIESPEGVDLPWIGYVRVRDLGLPAFTLLIGLIDGFNPCAMWVLVFLLSVLVNVKDRRKIAAIAGTFVVVSGLAYFAFMAAWLKLFMFVGIARPLQIVLGLLAVVIGLVNVKDFFFFKRGVTFSIPESAKPGIYARVRRIITTEYLSLAIGLSVILAVVVNVIELMCTAGLPAVYTQILSLQQLPTWKNYAYLGLYNVGYMFDDSIMVIAFVITLSHRKMREAEGRWLKLISGVVVLLLGFAMLFRPDWLQWN
jgi:hypothetical protein